MRAKAFAQASSRDFRQRISNTLKRKWQDPHFRSTMMEKIRARKSLAGSSTCEEHKRKISAAMRQKWLDPIYRQKALAGMAKRREEMGMVSSQLRRPTRMHTVGRSSEDFHKSSARLIQPRQNRKRKSKIASSPRPTLANSPVKDRVRNRTKSSCSCGKEDKLMGSATTVYTIDPEEARRLRMREQRRDLYDLLYGNEASRINNADGAAKVSILPGMFELSKFSNLIQQCHFIS